MAIPFLYAKRPPRYQLGGRFYPLFLRGRGLRPRLVARRSLVKPSAQIVADYPCRDGDKEGYGDVFHICMHLLPVPVWRWQRAKYTIFWGRREGAVNVDQSRFAVGSRSWDVFAYDLLPVQLHPFGVRFTDKSAAVNVSRSSAPFGLDLRDVFAYDLFANQLRPLGLLLE